MLKLIANNKTLDISNISFNITQNSPISTKTGNFVYSFTIPYSQNNAQIFNFPTRLQRLKKNSIELPGQILFNDKIIQTGTWHAKTSTEKTISLEMIFNNSKINSLIKDKYLPEFFDIELTYTSILSHINYQIYYTYPEVNHNFPTIYNPDFFDGKNENYKNFINHFDSDDTGTFIINNHNNENVLIPQLYLLYVIKQIFNYLNYTVTGSIFQNELLKKAMIYNNFSLENFHTKYYVITSQTNQQEISSSGNKILFDDDPKVNNEDEDECFNTSTSEYIIKEKGLYLLNLYIEYQCILANAYPQYIKISIFLEGNLLELIDTIQINPINYSWHSKNINYSHEFLESDIGKTFYIFIQFFELQGEEFDVPCIGNCKNSILTVDDQTSSTINRFNNTINYKNHIPNILVKDFLNNFYITFNVFPVVNDLNNSVKLISFSEIYKSNVNNLFENGLIKNSLKVYSNDYKGLKFTFDFQDSDNLINDNFLTLTENDYITSVNTLDDLPLNVPVNSIFFINCLNCFYKYSYDEDLNQYEWIPYSDHQPEYIIDEPTNDNEFEIKFAPLLMRNVAKYDLYNLNYPAISYPGNSNYYKLKNDIPLRIMFWIGIINPNTIYSYPLASTTKLDSFGNEILPINWKLSEITNYFFSTYIKWLKNRLKIEFQNEINSNNINNINFMQKYLFQYATILLEESYIKVQNKQLGPGKFTGWTI